MLQRLFLVAAREFRQITATRSFWITLLILPVALAIGPIAGRLMEDSGTDRVMIVDDSGREAGQIATQLKIEDGRAALTALARYAERHQLDRAAPRALWAQHDRWYDDVTVAQFLASGGVDRALAQMKPAMNANTPKFDRPEPAFKLIDTPAAIATASGPARDALIADAVRPPATSKTEDTKPLDYAVLIPTDFGSGRTPVRVWVSGSRPGAQFMQALQQVLTRDLRSRYLEQAGLGAQQAQTAAVITPAIAVDATPPGGGKEAIAVKSILPLVIAYMLLMSLLLSGSWMLQGLVEERSNKLLETVLACISPNELMYGKLTGVVGVGLTMVLIWIVCGIAAAYAGHGAIAEFIRPALAPLSSPWVVLAMIFYFLAGYLMFAMIFLAIGAMSDSIRDAQSYLTPVFLAIAMPFGILAQAILQGSQSIGVVILTWVPFYMPFTMLARLGAGVPLWEVLATMAILAIFVVGELWLLGRVFRQSLLRAGQKPSLASIARMVRAPAD